MKKCPFCAEEIQDEAIKCRYCNEFLDPALRPKVEPPKPKWYFRTVNIIIAFLCVGPLMLPLVWFNPHYHKWVKITLTVIMLITGYYMVVATIESIQLLKDLLGDFEQYSQY